ncbi:SUKH-4 family immunity protein [Streptomyces sp. NBC_01511]|uniref:SUKH-4 family immunity protein n=1 Tax=Streptomyces sp. NBC_01511 TaxID=2903889 RepID=UPI00386F218A
MHFAVTPDEVLTAFGLSGVVYFPRYKAAHSHLDDRTALFLSSVGLPDAEWFMSKAGLTEADSINLAEWYSDKGGVPDECRDWLVLGLIAETTLALAPDSGTVHSLGDGETQLVYAPIHRDVESLVYTLTRFESVRRQLAYDTEDVEARMDALRTEISGFDPLPFEDGESQWNLALEEVIDGIW